MGSELSMKNLFIIYWAKLLVITYAAFLIVRCFIRTLRNNFESNEANVFDYIHQYRYALEAIFDIMIGLSILFCVYYSSQAGSLRR